jgi:hypothetical protein
MVKRFLSGMFLLFVMVMMVNAQDKVTVSAGLAPYNDAKIVESAPFVKPMNVNTRGFSYQSTSLTASTLFKYFAGTPSAVTTIGTAQPNFFGNGDWANPTGVWKFYVMEQVAAPFTIYEVDTATGTITSMGGPTGLGAGLSPILFEWNHVNNTFYVYASTSAVSSGQLYSMNWATKVCTPIGGANTTCPGLIAAGITASGTALVGIDLVNDNIWRLKLSDGTATMVGASGYTANYGQDAGFDRSDWTLYWASCGGVVGLRTIDTATGVTAQIGTFPYTQVLATGFVAAPGPSIVHTPLPNTQNLAGPYVVNAQVIPQGSAISTSKIYWSRNSVTLTDSVTMTNSGGNNWTGNIPGNNTVATYRYKIWAIDALNRTVQTPIYSFTANNVDTTKPVITHTPIGATPKVLWPIAVNCAVTDAFGVDSVWVVWWKNANPKTRFNLAKGSGDNWSNLFNSVNGDVVPGDIIHYKIIARDASAQANKDSTAQIDFNIIALVNACIGTGTVSSNYPYTTYWMDGRTQMLFTAAELNAAGGIGNQNITQVGFNVITADPAPMNGFNVRFQHTTLTSLSGYTSTGWTTGFSGVYTVPGTGWRYINMTAPYFVYNGTSNLLVEICYDNSAYTSYSPVNSTAAAGMTYGGYTDNVTGCTYTTGSVQATRPNTCFTLTPATGTGNNTSQVPTVYSLSQNYPNPFNPVTKINFAIPKQGFVTLKVYDVLGREVRSLVNEVKTAGEYTVDFSGAELSSGVYFYRLESNGFTDIKRMMLIK